MRHFIKTKKIKQKNKKNAFKKISLFELQNSAKYMSFRAKI